MNLLKILDAPRFVKRLIMVMADLVILPASFFIAFLLRIDFTSLSLGPHAIPAVLCTVFFSVWYFARIGLYRAVIRFISQDIFKTVIKGVSFSAVTLGLMLVVFDTGIPRSIPFIYWTVAFILISGSRFGVRGFINSQNASAKTPVAIFGAGENGQALLRALERSDKYKPVVFIDHNKNFWGSLYQGIKVISPDRIGNLVRTNQVEQILLAMPSMSKKQRKDILESLEPLAVRVKSVPSFGQLISGAAEVDQLHDVNEIDLLGRDSVPPVESLLSACIEGKVVMVTGAGGSIGSELCRQIISLKPARLILFELNEYALYSIDKELRECIQSEKQFIDLVPLLGNVQNQPHMSAVMNTYSVNTVYHAAAYKHVPLVELNMLEGVKNNVFGTYHTALAAIGAGVESFVLISTDKAVRPTNVMGASKRLAELLLQGLTKNRAVLKNSGEGDAPLTCFSMVRFGNVLASSGSVVPLFKKQIKAGGPVTVTHPDIIRYFMTIPEAAQLVIQAGAIANGGDVFVLDMGEPVRIADLAKTLIHLSGFQVDENGSCPEGIAIEYTGLRPGEKLFEELLIDDNAQSTQHLRIMRAVETSLAWSDLEGILTLIKKANLAGDCNKIREILLSLDAGYKPGEKINDLLSLQKEVVNMNSNVVSVKEHLEDHAV